VSDVIAPLVPLNNGTAIPQLGLGTWPMDDDEVDRTIRLAVELGYRHIDTAAKYGNHTGVGRGVRGCGLPREELFVTTKLDGNFQGDDRAITGLQASLDQMGLDYVDLLLIHWPLPARGQFVSTWRTFEHLLETGQAKAIGVSNFKPAHLETLLGQTSVVPAVNQIQMNPRTPRVVERAFDDEHGIVTVAYSPLGQGSDLLSAPQLQQLGKLYDKTPAQILLRWYIELGVVAIPKSSSRERLQQNIDIFDFSLTDGDLRALELLSVPGEPGVDSDVDGH